MGTESDPSPPFSCPLSKMDQAASTALQEFFDSLVAESATFDSTTPSTGIGRSFVIVHLSLFGSKWHELTQHERERSIRNKCSILEMVAQLARIPGFKWSDYDNQLWLMKTQAYGENRSLHLAQQWLFRRRSRALRLHIFLHFSDSLARDLQHFRDFLTYTSADVLSESQRTWIERLNQNKPVGATAVACELNLSRRNLNESTMTTVSDILEAAGQAQIDGGVHRYPVKYRSTALCVRVWRSETAGRHCGVAKAPCTATRIARLRRLCASQVL